MSDLTKINEALAECNKRIVAFSASYTNKDFDKALIRLAQLEAAIPLAIIAVEEAKTNFETEELAASSS